MQGIQNVHRLVLETKIVKLVLVVLNGSNELVPAVVRNMELKGGTDRRKQVFAARLPGSVAETAETVRQSPTDVQPVAGRNR